MDKMIDDPKKDFVCDLWELEPDTQEKILRELIFRQYSYTRKIPPESISIFKRVFPKKRVLFVTYRRSEAHPIIGARIKDNECKLCDDIKKRINENRSKRQQLYKQKLEETFLIAAQYDASDVVRQNNAWGHLTDRNREIYEALFHKKLSIRQTAQLFDVSNTRIKQLRDKYLAKVRQLEINKADNF